MDLETLLKKAEERIDGYEREAKALRVELTATNALSTDTKESLTTELTKRDEQIDELKNAMADMETKWSEPVGITHKDEQDLLLEKTVKESLSLYLKINSNNFKGNLDKELLKLKGVEIYDLVEHRVKTLNITTPADGGMAIAEVLSREIIERARETYPIIGDVRLFNMPRVMRALVLISYPSVQTGLENVAGANLPETSTQKYAEVKNHIAKVHAKPRITNEALYAPDIDVYAHLLILLDEEIAIWLVNQVLYGNGSDKNMRGILSSNRLDITNLTGQSWKPTIDPSDARDPDMFPAFGTGVDGDLPPTDSAIMEWFTDLETELPTKYLNGAKYYMNRRSWARLSKVKDSTGRPLLMRSDESGFQKGVTKVINGYPVMLDDTLPDFNASGAPWVIFGVLNQAFSISPGDIDQMIVDPYTVDGCTVLKVEKEYFEMVGKNDAIIVGASTANAGS